MIKNIILILKDYNINGILVEKTDSFKDLTFNILKIFK